MASIEKRGDSYRVFVSNGYDSKGKKIVKTRTFKKPDNMSEKRWEKEIHKLALEFETEVLKGLYIDSNYTLEDFTERWIKDYAEKNLEETTLDSYKAELRTKILPALGHIKLNRLQPMQILSFLNNLMEDGVRLDGRPGGYSDRTIKYQWQILSSILQQSVYWQILPDNPCSRVKPPKNKKDKNEFSNEDIKYYDESQTMLLMDIIENELSNYKALLCKFEEGSNAWLNINQQNPLKYKVGIYIALFCGLRNGEVLGLTWNDIDFKERTISINKARARTNENGIVTKVPKNKTSIRTVSVPDILINLLSEYKEYQDEEREKCGDLWDGEWDNYPWLFTQWNGKGMDYSTLSKWLKKTVNKYNDEIIKDRSIPDKHKGDYLLPVLSFHKLRHTSATLLIGQNTDIRTVAARLGHAQTSTTMNIYVHGLKSVDRKASDALEGLLDKKNRGLRVVK